MRGFNSRRSQSRLLAAALSVIACAGCGPDAQAGNSAPSVSSPSLKPDSTSAEDETGPRPSLPPTQTVIDSIDATIALQRMSFALDVTSTLPDSSSPAMNSATGSFDDTTLGGIGTRSFHSDDPAIAANWGENPFEFVVVDNILWMLNPLGDPPAWAGFDLVEFGNAAGGNPLASVDVDGYLGVIAEATTEVVDAVERPGGGTTWIVSVRADDLLPVVSAGGAASRLAEMGAADSGLTAQLQLEANQDGHIVSITGDLDEWWSNAVSLLPGAKEAPNSDYTLRLDLKLSQFEVPLNPEPPCDDPSQSLQEGQTVYICS